MNNVKQIIKEEVLRYLREYDDEDVYEVFEMQDRLKFELLNDFLMHNNAQFTKRIFWRVVPSARLKKIWQDYIKTGLVRDVKGLDYIESIMIRNALNLETLTYLSGHSSSDPSYDFDDAWGDYIKDYIQKTTSNTHVDIDQTEIPFDNPSLPHIRKQPVVNLALNPNYANIKNIPFETYVEENKDNLDPEKMKTDLMEILSGHFYDYYAVDSKGTYIMSDYGTRPLVELAFHLAQENNPEKKVVIIDKMLNIAHQSSDLASWFVQGGSSALSDISGYYSDGNYSWDQKSVISGEK
jgi:hypothetical protein